MPSWLWSKRHHQKPELQVLFLSCVARVCPHCPKGSPAIVAFKSTTGFFRFGFDAFARRALPLRTCHFALRINLCSCSSFVFLNILSPGHGHPWWGQCSVSNVVSQNVTSWNSFLTLSSLQLKSQLFLVSRVKTGFCLYIKILFSDWHIHSPVTIKYWYYMFLQTRDMLLLYISYASHNHNISIICVISLSDYLWADMFFIWRWMSNLLLQQLDLHIHNSAWRSTHATHTHTHSHMHFPVFTNPRSLSRCAPVWEDGKQKLWWLQGLQAFIQHPQQQAAHTLLVIQRLIKNGDFLHTLTQLPDTFII